MRVNSIPIKSWKVAQNYLFSCNCIFHNNTNIDITSIHDSHIYLRSRETKDLDRRLTDWINDLVVLQESSVLSAYCLPFVFLSHEALLSLYHFAYYFILVKWIFIKFYRQECILYLIVLTHIITQRKWHVLFYRVFRL